MANNTVTKRFDLVAGRKYQTKHGEEKTHWINCGEGAEWSDGGISIRLHAVPVANWFDGSLRLFEKKPREESSRAGSPAVAAADNFDDPDLPF